MRPTSTTRFLPVAASAIGVVVALGACSSSGSGGGSSSSSSQGSTMPHSPSGLATKTSPTSPTGTGTRSVVGGQPGASSSSSSASATSSSSSTKAAPKTDAAGACRTANSKSNAAISQWNRAVASKSATRLDAGARNFRLTAGQLRTLPKKSGNAGFSSRVRAVANDLDAMARARFTGQTVNPGQYNRDSDKLVSYCQDLLTKK